MAETGEGTVTHEAKDDAGVERVKEACVEKLSAFGVEAEVAQKLMSHEQGIAFDVPVEGVTDYHQEVLIRPDKHGSDVEGDLAVKARIAHHGGQAAHSDTIWDEVKYSLVAMGQVDIDELCDQIQSASMLRIPIIDEPLPN